MSQDLQESNQGDNLQVQGLRRDDRDDAPVPAQVVREHAVGDVPAKLP